MRLLLFMLCPIAMIAQSRAVYDINVTTIWTSSEHTWVPGNAHWSDLIGATHNTPNAFFQVGQLATVGIKDVAELGLNTEITNEVNAAISGGTADQLLQDGFFPNVGHGDNAGFTNVTVDENFPLVTLVAMVAPSPDWFIAANSINLRSGNPSIRNGWKDTFTIDLFAYDAGTDSGNNYDALDVITNPFQPISLITGSPINGVRMGTMTFTYKSSALSVNDVQTNNTIRLHPNPATSNQISILNIGSLKSITIYNTLGKEVKSIKNISAVNNYSLDISNISNGIYIIKLLDAENRSTNKKLIINR